MSGQVRLGLFLVSAAGFAALFLWGLLRLPSFGFYQGPYGDIINSSVVFERHTTDAVTAVNFDYRGMDTIGEEFILFSSVAGCMLLLRERRDEADLEERQRIAEGRGGQTSSAVRALALAFAVPGAIFGWYIVSHGQLTPGGGFQGGVILSSSAIFLYLAGEYAAMRKMNPISLLELAEAAGAGGYVVVGLAGLIVSGSFLLNVLPLGATGEVDSSGTILAISIAVGLEVAAAFVLLMIEFLEQTLEIRQRRRV